MDNRTLVTTVVYGLLNLIKAVVKLVIFAKSNIFLY